MRIWRLTLAKHRASALEGVGARRFGGRWNAIGTAMVYTSCSLELAVLESFVQAHPDELGKAGHLWLEFQIPDNAIETLDALPAQWDALPPYSPNVQAVGDRWIASNRSLALSVPAAVLPERRNILINPAHPRFAQIQPVAAAPFTWPKRLANYLLLKGTTF